MVLYQILSLLIVICAVFSYINHKFIKWPPTIAIMVLSMGFSVLLVISSYFFPELHQFAVQTIGAIDFHTLLMKMMLSFLLYAGGFQLNARRLALQKWPILVLATIGTLISTFLVGIAFYYIFSGFGIPVPFILCLVFGALISPTDPIAVLAILRNAGIPETLELKIAGESLFNDGIAVVLFSVLIELAINGTGTFQPALVLLLFFKEALGGAVLGIALGYIGYILLKSLDDSKLETLITLAIVMGGYLLADQLDISGPIAMVIAGIMTGNSDKQQRIDPVRDYLGKFWELLDEILNAVLFLLVGFEMLLINRNTTILGIGLIGIPVVLAVRWISVAVPVFGLQKWIRFEKGSTLLLTWGGLRGGLSVAMALSLPETLFRDTFVSITYVIVVFSIIVQGLSINRFGKLAKVADS